MSIQVKGTATQRDYNMQLERVYLDKLFEIAEPTKEFRASYKSMAELTEVPSNIVANVMQMLDTHGVLKRRFEYSPKGKVAFWSILTSKEHAVNLLEKNHAARPKARKMRKRNGAVVNGSPKSLQAAIGAEGTIIAQAKSWVEKTRQYMKASDLITSNLENLRAAGIDVDEDAYLSAIRVAHDERLASIALVIPYIEALERR